MKVGLIARMDKSGLGQGQTLRLTRLLKPDYLMVIDSTMFNQNQQYPEWYEGYKKCIIDGFPDEHQIKAFSSNVDVVISCETFYHPQFTRYAEEMDVRTILIANYEFFDWLRPEYRITPLPDKIISPSYWHLDELTEDYNATYLPTPIFDDEFKEARFANLRRTEKPRYLFLNGKSALYHRNGLESVYAALELSKGDYELVIKSQSDIVKHPDPRIIYDFTNPDNQSEIYKNFDAMILPRRYAGQCLPMCEALMSGLPVIMTDIDPNNKILPKEWLVPARKTGAFMTRIMLDLYTADTRKLANMIDNFKPSIHSKTKAYEIGKQFEATSLRSKYDEVIKEAMTW